MNIVIITGANRLSCEYLIYQFSLNLKIVGLVLETQDFSFEDRPWLSEYVKNSEKCFSLDIQQKFVPTQTQFPFIETIDINSFKVINFIKNLQPDVVLLFGTSIIKNKFLADFAIPIINLHTGLTPYYRGSLSSFWCMFDNKPECLGSTIHYVTKIIDGGPIIHQVRPIISELDTIHDLAHKNFLAGVSAAVHLIGCIVPSDLPYGIVPDLNKGCFKKSANFTYKALIKAEQNISNGIIPKYLQQKQIRDSFYPIIKSKSVP